MAVAAGLATIIAPVAVSFGSPALADTTGTPDLNTRATAAPAPAPSPSPVATTGVLAPGALSGIVGGQAIHVHVDGTAGKFNGVQTARLCRSGLTITTSSQLSPTSFGNCIAAPLPGPANDAALTAINSDAGKQFVDFDFRVGSGTETTHPGPGSPITCDQNNPCALWLQESVDTSINSTGSVFKHFDINYFGAATAPQNPTGTPGNTTATFNWLAPASLFGGTLQNYTVTLSPAAGTPASPATVTPDGSGNGSITFTGLSNFTTYTASIVANTVASDGTTTATSPAATASATPGPPAPGGLAATPGDHQVTLTYTAPSGPAPTSYEITVSPTVAGSPFTTTATTFTVTGLTNGTVYTFSVRAFYGGTNFSQPATVSATPNGTLITQHIYVSRPQGALVLTQVCGTTANGNTSAAPYQNGNNPTTAPVAPGTSATPGNQSSAVGTPDPNFTANGGYPYPQDPNTGAALFTYPTDCRVDLGAAKLITTGAGAGQYFKADGALNQVTVVDTRDTDPGWTINGRTTAFQSGVNSFSGDDLGWHPIVTATTPGFTSPDGSYLQVVNVGPDVVTPAMGPAGNGLGAAARTLASAPAKASTGPTSNTGGLGIARLDADLHLLIPIFAIHGNYVSVLTITAV